MMMMMIGQFVALCSGYVPSDDSEKWNEDPQVPVGLPSAEPPEPVDMETADNQLPSGSQQDSSMQGALITTSLYTTRPTSPLHSKLTSLYGICLYLFVCVGSDASDSSKQLEDLREQLKATLEFCLSR